MGKSDRISISGDLDFARASRDALSQTGKQIANWHSPECRLFTAIFINHVCFSVTAVQ